MTDEQLASCAGVADDTVCSFNDRTRLCNGGICLEVICGDGVRLGQEECDGDDLGGTTVTCAALGYYDDNGPVTCTVHCSFDTHNCARTCGDYVVDVGKEICDAPLGDVIGDCTDYGYYVSAPVGCSNRCTPETSNCVGFCGDGVANGNEACELGISIPVGTCVDYGYDVGQIACNGFCTPDFAACGGIGWKTVHLLVGGRAIYPFGANDYLVGDTHGLVRITNGVETRVLNNNVELPSMTDIWAAGPADLWAVGSNSQLAHFDGANWSFSTAPGSGQLNAVWGASSSSVYAVGYERLVHFDGNSWTTIPSPFATGYDLRDVWATGSDIFVIGTGVTPQIAHYNGSIWTIQGFLPQSAPLAVWGTSATNVWAVGGGGAIFHFDGTWSSALPSPATGPLGEIWGRGPNDIYVGGIGSALHYDGTTWLEMQPVTNRSFDSIRGVGDELVAATYTGLLRFSGAAWSPVMLPPGNSTMDVAFGTAPDDVFVLTSNAGLFRWDSSGFVAVAGSPTNAVTTMWAGGGSIFIGDYNGDVYQFNGVSWSKQVFSTFTVPALWGTGPNDMYVATGNTVQHYTGTWTPETPNNFGILGVWGDANATFVIGAGGVSRRASNGTWTLQTIPSGTPRLYGVWGSSSTDVFAVGDNGAIIHFDGVSWTKMDSHTPVFLNDVAGFGPTNVFAVGDGGTVLHYDGATWTPVRSDTFELAKCIAIRGDRALFGFGSLSVRQLAIPGPW